MNQRNLLYLDLDGVMADFDAHFPAQFGLDHKSMADDAMWETINRHPTYFRDMPVCIGAKEFFDSVAWADPIILTACPRTNYPRSPSRSVNGCVSTCPRLVSFFRSWAAATSRCSCAARAIS